jgi:hypothetical protein
MATATNTFNSATETAKHKAAEAASSVASKASEAATNVADRARQGASAVGQRVEDATHAVGGGMKSLAETIRDKAPHEGIAGSAAGSLASSLESGGRYLEQEGIQGIAEDVTNLIRRNPIPALLFGIGVGFCMARLTMRR